MALLAVTVAVWALVLGFNPGVTLVLLALAGVVLARTVTMQAPR